MNEFELIECGKCEHFREYFAYYPIRPTGWCSISGKRKISYSICDEINK